MTRFHHVLLRTSDVEAARTFYAGALGRERLHIVQLHEQAVARGAPPHWIGFLAVDDVDRALARFVERGATALGPKWTNPEGLEAVTLRDPGGAVVTLGKPPAPVSIERDSDADVVGCTLHTNDVERAKVDYAELFGWELAEPRDYGELGVVHPFAWAPGQPPAGAMIDIARRPGVHPHWLFHFRVPSLEPAIAAIRSAGGTALTLPFEERMAICEDPQGAAFAIQESPPGS